MLDTVNLEMLRVDAILEDVEQITDVAGKAATTVDAVTSAPAEAVTSIVDRIRGSLGSKRADKAKQGTSGLSHWRTAGQRTNPPGRATRSSG